MEVVAGPGPTTTSDAASRGGDIGNNSEKNSQRKHRQPSDEAAQSSDDYVECARALVLEHLVQNCHKKSALAFVAGLAGKPSLDPDTVEDMGQRETILAFLTQGHVMDAVERADAFVARKARRVKRKETTVRAAFPELYFRLSCQHFVELVRQRQTDSALSFAQQTLALFGTTDANLIVLQDITVLLAYDEPERCPKGNLLDPAHRETLATDLNLHLYNFCKTDSAVTQSTCPPPPPLADAEISDTSSTTNDSLAKVGRLELVLRQLSACGALSVPPFKLEQKL